MAFTAVIIVGMVFYVSENLKIPRKSAMLVNEKIRNSCRTERSD